MSRYLKGVVCFAVAVVGGGVAQGLIVGAAAAWCTIVIGALATVGVVAAKNTGPSGPPEYVDLRKDAPLTSSSNLTKVTLTDPEPPPVKKAAAKKAAPARKAAKKR